MFLIDSRTVLRIVVTGGRLLLVSVGFCLCAVQVTAQVVVRGQVREAEALQPLASAHVVVEGTSEGTITNHQGDFEITLSALPAVLLVRHLGYAIARIELGPNDPRTISVVLEPSVFELPEVLITGDAFAENVMREVIRRKAARRSHLNGNRARGYSRITLESRGQIVLVSEHVFDRYDARGQGPHLVIRSRRSTAEFWSDLGLTPAPQDLSQDHVAIRNLSFIGPTNPNALDYYHFTFSGRRQYGEQSIYDFFVAPKTGLDATFIGRISIVDSVYALIEAELRPASHVVFAPSVVNWDLFYRQQFASVDSFWLPVDLRIDGRIHVEPEGQATGPAAVQQIARLFDYAINPPLPEQVFAQPDGLQLDSASVQRDDLFLMGMDMVALTPREVVALDYLRREPPLTLRQALPARRAERGAEMEALGFAEGDPPQFVWPLVGGYAPWLRYNRVDGAFVGVGTALDFGDRTSFGVRLAKSLAYGPTRVAGALTQQHSSRLSSTVVFERDLQPLYGTTIHSVAMNSLSARLLHHDYFDWYWAESGRLTTRYNARRYRVRATYAMAHHSSVERTIHSAWPYKRSFPPNPSVDRGLHSAIQVAVATGRHWQPYYLNPHRRAELSLEGGSIRFEDAYWRIRLHADTHVETIYSNRPKPAYLALRLLAGASRGNLPIVRRNTVEGSMGPVAALGVIRSVRNRRLSGDHTLGLHWEHDFRTLPFEAMRLESVVRKDVGLRLGGAHARVWPGEGWHNELTLSAVIVPLRLDLTRRLGQSGWYLTVGLAGRR